MFVNSVEIFVYNIYIICMISANKCASRISIFCEISDLFIGREKAIVYIIILSTHIQPTIASFVLKYSACQNYRTQSCFAIESSNMLCSKYSLINLVMDLCSQVGSRFCTDNRLTWFCELSLVIWMQCALRSAASCKGEPRICCVHKPRGLFRRGTGNSSLSHRGILLFRAQPGQRDRRRCRQHRYATGKTKLESTTGVSAPRPPLPHFQLSNLHLSEAEMIWVAG